MNIKIPVWIKSFLIGFIVLTFGTGTWSLLARTNIDLAPHIPWSFLLMIFILWLLWKFLSGSLGTWPDKNLRKLWMRANKVKPSVKNLIWMVAIAYGFMLYFLFLVTSRLFTRESGPIEQVERISEYPALTVIALIVMTSIVAGVIEEISFRGYIQKPMELKYGPVIAILSVALFFTLLHLPNATVSPETMPIFFLGSIGWGLIAYYSDSIIPGVIVHSIFDIVSFTWMWQNLDIAREYASESVLNGSMDGSFMIQAAILIILLITVVVLFYRIHHKMKINLECTNNTSGIFSVNDR